MKRILSLTFLLLIFMSVFPASVFAQWAILDPAKAKGSNYTQSDAYAKALDAVFAGDIDIYKEIGCKTEQNMKLGYSMSTSTKYYIKSKATGTVYWGMQCYAYANAVYNKLFGEMPYQGLSKFHHSRYVMKGSGGKNTLSYQEFVNAGIRSGAYIRTTPNSNNSYNGGDGHSMVLLSYDSKGVVYIEGNSDGKGLVRIFNQTWEEFNKTELKGVKRYLCHIIQANDSYYEQHYPENVEEKAYIAQCEFYPSSYKIKAVNPANLRNMPCNSNTNAASKILVNELPVGTTFTATGIYKNTEGNYWYRVLYNNKTYYLYAKNTTAVEIIPDAVLTGAKYPTTLIKGNSYTLEGKVSSTYSTLTHLTGQVLNSSGKVVGSKQVKVTNNSYSIKNSELDTSIKFGSLVDGKYRLVLLADVMTYYVSNTQKLEGVGVCQTLLNKEFTVHEHKYSASGYESAHPHRAMSKCSCGDVKYGAANYKTSVKVTAPSCKAEGKRETVCATCGYVENTEILVKLTHGETYEKVINPTCSVEGRKEYRCKVCDAEVSYDIIPRLSHSGIHTEVSDATCSKEGKKESICGVCNEVLVTEVIPKKSHTITVINSSPTYSGDKYCSVCDTVVEKGDIIEIIYFLGDVNSDGKVNALDATQILRYANNKSSVLTGCVKGDEKFLSADVNKDGKINALDATQILRYANNKSSVLK